MRGSEQSVSEPDGVVCTRGNVIRFLHLNSYIFIANFNYDRILFLGSCLRVVSIAILLLVLFWEVLRPSGSIPG